MKLTLRHVALAVSACGALFASVSANAQISGDVVRVGFLTDISGIYSDNDGQGGVEAIKMAVQDFGDINGKKVEFVFADHLNKVDIASSKAREWFDQQGLDMLVIGANSGAALALANRYPDEAREHGRYARPAGVPGSRPWRDHRSADCTLRPSLS